MKIEHNYQTKIDLKVVIMVSWFIVWLNKWQRNYDVELIKSKYVITTFWIFGMKWEVVIKREMKLVPISMLVYERKSR